MRVRVGQDTFWQGACVPLGVSGLQFQTALAIDAPSWAAERPHTTALGAVVPPVIG